MIEANSLTRNFGAFTAVDSLSLQVPEGSIVALLGPNGAGKSTTVRMLAGLLAPSGGTAHVGGFDVATQAQAVRAHIGLVTDTPGLHDQMTPAAYLDFFGQLYGMPRAARQSRIDDLLTMFDLQDVSRNRMATFSRGMQQKVALARALLHEPGVLFLDEPTSGLDPMAARMVRDLVVGLKHASRSIVLCTHDLHEAERLADVIAIMRRGRIVASGTAEALRTAASQTTDVHVTLARPLPEALAIVQSVDGVLDPRQQDNSLHYHAADPKLTNPSVIACLVSSGAQVVSVTTTPVTLEEVFRQAMNAEPAP
jgi:ABC-2 type transport system ATP-binding protein